MDCLLLALEKMPTSMQKFYQGKPVPVDDEMSKTWTSVTHTPCVCCAELSRFSCVWLFVMLWTIACQALLCPWDSPGKSAGVSCYALLQGIFPVQRPKLGFLHCRHPKVSKQQAYIKNKQTKHQTPPPNERSTLTASIFIWYNDSFIHLILNVYQCARDSVRYQKNRWSRTQSLP